jgi:aminopeptidase N
MTNPDNTMPAGPPTTAPSGTPPSGFPPPAETAPTGDGGGRRRRWPFVVLAVVVLLAVAAAGFLLAGGDDDGDEDDAASATTAEPTPSTTESTEPDQGGTVGDDTVGDSYAPETGAGGYDASHYDIDFTYDPGDGSIAGVTTMTATATQDLSAFSVDLLALDVGQVSVDGEEAEVQVDDRNIEITPAEGIAEDDEFEVEVAYDGVPEPVITAGFPTGWLDTDDGGAYVIGEPDGAATWFPGNDHPSDKATFDVAVTVPDGWTVAGNGELEDQEEGPDGVTWTWTEDDEMATYLVTVAIGHYRMVEEETDGGIPLVSFYPEDQADELTATFSDAGDMIDAFEELFGPYPFDEYGAIVVPEGTGLALETQTRSTFGIDVAGIEDFRAHELAHMWFGDAVTPERWEDIWLSEGFASYAEMLWNEASDPDFDIDAEARSRRQSLLGYDEGPIVDPGVDRWFGDAVYQRGSLVLHALRTTVGDDQFFEILQRWVEEHDGGNATTSDFVDLAEEVSGQDLDDFFHQWLRQDGVPELP